MSERCCGYNVIMGKEGRLKGVEGRFLSPDVAEMMAKDLSSSMPEEPVYLIGKDGSRKMYLGGVDISFGNKEKPAGIVADLESARREILRLNNILRSFFYRFSSSWLGRAGIPVYSPCEKCHIVASKDIALEQLTREMDLVKDDVLTLRRMGLEESHKKYELACQLEAVRKDLEHANTRIAEQKEVLDQVKWDRSKGLDEQGRAWLTERRTAEAKALSLTFELNEMNSRLEKALLDVESARRERDEYKDEVDDLAHQISNQVYMGNSVEHIYQKMLNYKEQLSSIFKTLASLGFKDGGGSFEDSLSDFIKKQRKGK